MDSLAAMLSGPHARGAFVLRSDLVAPWSVRIEDEAPLTVVVVVRGSAVLCLDGHPEVRLAAGDAALVRGETGYRVADAASTEPQARIGPGQVCHKPDGSPLSEFRTLGVCTWGNLPDGTPAGTGGAAAETVLLTGTYEQADQVSHHLLAHLPPSVVVGADDAGPGTAAVVELLTAELTGDRPAQEVVLDRLVDLLAVSLLRAWFDASDERPPWYAAHDDPVVGGALRRMHHEPERAWTLASLAADVGVSRATLARAFARDLGEPVMGYLARWRVDLAADLLVGTDLTVENVAHRVGYGSGFALSKAFARRHGSTPGAYRRRAGAASRAG